MKIKNYQKCLTKLSIIFTLFILLFTLSVSQSYAETYKEWTEKTNLEPDKVWTINFNNDINQSTINSNNVYVIDEGNNIFNTKTDIINSKTIKVTPISNYSYGKVYYLYIKNIEKSNSNDILKENIRMKFSIKNDPAIIDFGTPENLTLSQVKERILGSWRIYYDIDNTNNYWEYSYFDNGQGEMKNVSDGEISIKSNFTYSFMSADHLVTYSSNTYWYYTIAFSENKMMRTQDDGKNHIYVKVN